MRTQRLISCQVFLILWLVALLVPFGIHALEPRLGVLAGLILPCVWIKRMPATCLGGGAFIGFPMAMFQLAAALGWLTHGLWMAVR